jgi:Fe-S oxidoreductase
MHKLSDQVVALVAKYKGLMWGEHGKGYRSEYGPEFFGDKLFTELRRIKSAFDPLNKMNPGKICTPLDSQSELVKVSDTKRGYYDRQIPVVVRDSFKEAMECNGNGLCFNYDTSSPMCPSMKVLADRRHSPKGRAGVVREWLRQLSEQGIDVLDLEHQVLKGEKPLRSLMQRVSNTLAAKNKTDFSHEVFEVMSGCLACKACASQCPIKVDVPSFRSRFFNIYYSRYQRPLKDYFVANIESMLPLMAISPAIVNGVLSSKFVQAVLKSTIGYVDAPLLSTPLLKTRIGLLKLIEYDYAKLSRMSEADKAKSVLIVQDPFTSFYDAQVVEEFAQLAIKLGYTPILLPFKPNGKAQHIKGFMKQFSTTAKNTADFLTQVSGLGIDMVGVDPALVLCYRDEYEELLGEKATQFEVKTVHEWLLPVVDKDKTDYPLVDIEWKLFAHCTEKTKLPNAEKEWGQIFKHFGAKLTAVPVGCCGMAGTFGHELTSFEMSKDIYELSWKQRFEQNEISNCLVTGYSCRSQVKRFENQVTKHPLQALNAMLSQ